MIDGSPTLWKKHWLITDAHDGTRQEGRQNPVHPDGHQHAHSHSGAFEWRGGQARPHPTGPLSFLISPCSCPAKHVQANASKEWESAWFQVMVKGPASGCYAASKIIASLVDELDDCVAHFNIHRRHLGGPTIQRVSADTNVRIFVPGRKDEGHDIQLEGEVSNVMRALALIMAAVYGAGGSDKKKKKKEQGR